MKIGQQKLKSYYLGSNTNTSSIKLQHVKLLNLKK